MSPQVRLDEVTDALQSALSVSSLELIAQGGQKYVFAGELEGFPAVVKVIFLPSGPDGLMVLERAQREVEVLAEIDSPRVVRVLSEVVELDFANGLRAVTWVEEKLDGFDMGRDLDKQWNYERCSRLLVHLGEALAAFHELDVVHRDLSPANVRELSDGSFALMDPGLARHLAKTALTGVFQPGTPGHRSPEHIPGGDIQPVSDIFALGILAYRALAGTLPIDPSGPEDDYYRRLRDYDSPDIGATCTDIPAPLRDVINRCLNRQPARRFLDGQELLDELQSHSAVFGAYFTPNGL